MTKLEPLYDKKNQCPHCQKAFTTKKFRSSAIKVVRHDSDFCPIYTPEEYNPLFYYIHVCPFCGYSFSDEFSPYFPPGTEKQISEKISKRWIQQDFSGSRSIHDSIKTYKLAIYTGTLKKEKHIMMAGLYLRLSWLYRYLANEEQEQRFQHLAQQEYKESLFTGDYQNSQVSEMRILYLLGELATRCDQTEDATKYFSEVIEKQRFATEPKLVEMAKERWQTIRDKKKSTNALSTEHSETPLSNSQ